MGTLQVDDYRDNIIYYVEANQEPEFEEDEQLYEDMIGEHTDEETWYASPRLLF